MEFERLGNYVGTIFDPIKIRQFIKLVWKTNWVMFVQEFDNICKFSSNQNLFEVCERNCFL